MSATVHTEPAIDLGLKREEDTHTVIQRKRTSTHLLRNERILCVDTDDYVYCTKGPFALCYIIEKREAYLKYSSSNPFNIKLYVP